MRNHGLTILKQKLHGNKTAGPVLLALAGVLAGCAAPLPRLSFSPFYTPRPRPVEVWTLSFVGDLMAHTVNLAMKDPGLQYSNIRSLLAGDTLTFANLETPVVPDRPQAGYPLFNVHPPYVQAAFQSGIDVVSVANNHICDQGAAGVTATQAFLRQAGVENGILSNGIRNPGDEFTVTEIPLGLFRLGFLAITDLTNRREGIELLHFVALRNPEQRKKILAFLAKTTPRYDFFILSFHGGKEYFRGIEAYKEDFFREALEAGVTIVWGHHPHVLQPWYTLSRGDTRLVMHSTGNLVSGQPGRLRSPRAEADWAWTGDAAVFQVRLMEVQGRLRIVSVTPVPIIHFYRPGPGVRIFPLETLPERITDPPWRAYFAERRDLVAAALRPLNSRNLRVE